MFSMDLSGDLVPYAAVSIVLLSLLGGLISFRRLDPISPASLWIDSPRFLTRWFFRINLFMGCFLLPCSVVVFVSSPLMRMAAIENALVALPLLARQILLLGPIILLWVWMYRILVKDARSADSIQKSS